MHAIAYAHHSSMGTYFAHLIIRGFVYRIMFHLPFLAAAVVAVIAVYWIFFRKGAKR